MRKKLLVISSNVPLPDQNSGDLRLFSLLSLLVQDYDITYLARGKMSDDEAENRRYEKELRYLGVEVFVGHQSLRNILRKKRFAAAIIEFYFIAEEYLSRLRILQPQCPIIVDSVDVHYARLFNKHQITKAVADLEIATETKKRELSVYGKADAVITVTEDDARDIRHEGNAINTVVIPNIHRLTTTDTPPKNPYGLIFVGGFWHEPNVDAVHYFCQEIWPLIREREPRTRLTVVGSHPPESILALANDEITVTGYVPSVTPYLHQNRVSVAPLRFGAGMKGKIGEAMAHGLPVVTSTVGAEGMSLVHGKNVLIADCASDFSNAVFTLFRNQDLYETLRINGLQYIADHLTAEQAGRKLKKFLRTTEETKVKRLGFLEKLSFIYGYLMDRFVKQS